MQLAVKLVGFALVTPMAMALAGGWEAITADPSRLDLFAGGSPQSGWRLLFFLAPAFVVSPGLMQKALGARDDAAVTTGMALNGVALIVFAALPTIIGMSARTHVPGHQPGPGVCDDGGALTPVFGALALAAVFSAEASAADAVLLHARDVGVARSVSRVRAAGRDRSRHAARGARRRPSSAACSASGWR